MAFILILAFILRFWQLDLKLLHHDEAIHSWFCYEFLTRGVWQYDPSYHGPFLYYVTTGMFALIGPSDFAARLLPSLFGFAIIPLVYAIYRIGYISKNQMLVAALFIAISPDMVYFSRFLRHDIFMLFFTMLLLVAILYYFERGQTRFAVLAAIAAAGALCCKEEMPVIIIIFTVFFAFSAWKGRFILPQKWKTDLMLFVIIIVVIMSMLYSAFFNHVDTLIGQNFSIATQGVHFEAKTTGWYQAIDHWTDYAQPAAARWPDVLLHPALPALRAPHLHPRHGRDRPVHHRRAPPGAFFQEDQELVPGAPLYLAGERSCGSHPAADAGRTGRE